jgi:hypothetical protein
MMVVLGNLLGRRPETRLKVFLLSVERTPHTMREIGVGKKRFYVYSPEVMVSFARACHRAREISEQKLIQFELTYNNVCV